MQKHKIVILFSRLSDYMINVLDHWVKTSNVELHVIRKEVDQKEAPFEFKNEYAGIFLYDRETFSFETMFEKVQNINPDMILCSGWSDKEYLKVVSYYSGKIPTVMSMDNQWNGSIKQKIATLVSPFTLKKKFSHIWVPGEPQVVYAKKLGFTDEQIFKGFYVANSDNFSVNIINPERKFIKRFIYVGRYVDVKGIKDLWQAFIELQNENPNEWELICIGTGPLYEEKAEHPKIKHVGFVQPKDLKDYMAEGGVFVLPSHFEPWGVVVHEFALAGFPMFVSDAVGAATQFVHDNKNGYVFKRGDSLNLKEKLASMMLSNEDTLKTMGEYSFNMSKTINKENWIKTANKLLIEMKKYNELKT
ncbi:glycosyltransferase family 4 protein [Sulfurovum sp.]|uniref:glycosyltransferase family 4 protein n=1 Tax=Sulfurovum sp. TaxID=1969726 RepID=UPI0035634C39